MSCLTNEAKCRRVLNSSLASFRFYAKSIEVALISAALYKLPLVLI